MGFNSPGRCARSGRRYGSCSPQVIPVPDLIHIVAKGQQLSTEMMGSDTGLHADQAGWHVGETLLDLSPRELLAQDHGPAGIQADQVEAVLANVDAKCRCQGWQRAEAEH
jgi:hypothetical protein